MEAMTTSGSATVTLPTDEQILITREFDAPRHLVYKAWTTPELVKRWWSGGHGEVTIAEIDLRVGGMWRYVLIANEGFEVGFHGEYREIVPDERIVSTEVYEGMPEGEALNTLTLTEEDGRTTMSILVAALLPGAPRRPHQLRHGGRHAEVDGPPRAGGGLAPLSSRPRPPSARGRFATLAPGGRLRARFPPLPGPLLCGSGCCPRRYRTSSRPCSRRRACSR